MSFSLATLIPNEHELLEDEITRTEAELDAVSNKLQRLVQLRQLGQDTEAAKERSTNSRQRSLRRSHATSKSLPLLRS